MNTEHPHHDDIPADERPGRLRRFALPAVAVAGAVTVGSFLAPVGLVSADVDDDATADDEGMSDGETAVNGEAADQDDQARSGDGESRRDRRSDGRRSLALGLSKVGDVVTDTLGVTTAELRAAFLEGKSLADVAAEQGVEIAELTDALSDAAQTRLDEAVADGTVDEERAAAIGERLDERIDEMVNATFDGSRLRANRAERVIARGEYRQDLAEFLGLTIDELREARTDGRTLAEIAAEQGVSEDDLMAFIVEGARERVEEAVEEGRLEADEADERVADFEERVAEMIDAEPGERTDGKRGLRRGRAALRDGRMDSNADTRGTAEEGVQDISA